MERPDFVRVQRHVVADEIRVRRREQPPQRAILGGAYLRPSLGRVASAEHGAENRDDDERDRGARTPRRHDAVRFGFGFGSARAFARERARRRRAMRVA
eukprot:31275-Pelagococcus_subviridis.AAC.6